MNTGDKQEMDSLMRGAAAVSKTEVIQCHQEHGKLTGDERGP